MHERHKGAERLQWQDRQRDPGMGKQLLLGNKEHAINSSSIQCISQQKTVLKCLSKVHPLDRRGAQFILSFTSCNLHTHTHISLILYYGIFKEYLIWQFHVIHNVSRCS